MLILKKKYGNAKKQNNKQTQTKPLKKKNKYRGFTLPDIKTYKAT